jgi:uncharacterized membrane protein YphA (DoxX/SURF4 family)
MSGTGTPKFVASVLDFAPTGFLARLLLVGAFGLTPPALWAALTIAVELIGPLLILTGRLVWLGAGILGVFTFFAALVANAFWAMPEGSERFGATNAFFEHMGLVGGFILVAILAYRTQRSA